MRVLVAASVTLLFVGSCTSEHKSLTGPTKGLAHIPSFSTSSATNSGASFATDKDDYAPGETVGLTGTGWQPGDALAIHLTVDPATHDPVDWSVTVDGNGDFTDASYTVSDLDAGVTLTIVATDSASGETATATFTDAGIGNGSLCADAPGFGSAACPSPATTPTTKLNSTHYTQQVGTSATYQIIGASDALSATNSCAIGEVEVQIQSTPLGNSIVCGGLSGSTITFTWPAPSNGCQTSIVAYRTSSTGSGFSNSNNDIVNDGSDNGSPNSPGGIAYVDEHGDVVSCASVGTEIHDASHTVVSSVSSGTTVHDKATVTGLTTLGTATGTVTFTFFTNGTCDGTGTSAGTVSLVSGVAHPSNSEGPLSSGSYSFRAHYNGDGNYDAVDSPCEPLTVGAPEAEPPTIKKDAAGSYKNTFKWTITKDVDKTLVEQIGGNATFNYTVKVSHDGGTISNVKVTGTITVSNPNTADITGANVTDALTAAGSSCSVTSGTGVALTPGDNTFAYSCSLTGLPLTAPDNKATVTWPAQTVAGNSLAAGSADFTFSGVSFTKDDIDECASVSDSYAGTLGTVCVGNANPTSFNYSRTVPVPQFDCQSYSNTASFTTNDNGATGSANQTVKVCGPAKTGALTIGFWKTTNGQNLIKTYCANTLDDYLAGLGNGSGPFMDASGKNCTQLATYVFNILNGASATDMNKMLKAQMLGTALDVWFSGPGWTSTKSGGVKPPSNFLSHNALGTFNMDVTAVCPMVDNTTTGTATCLNNKPSTDAVASGAVPNSPMSMQAILDYAATTPSPFNGSTVSSVWYGGDRTKEEILKNIFDQFNNQMAFGSF